MMGIGFEEHNQEVRKVWDSFNNRNPIRVPIIFNFSCRFFLLNKEINVKGYTFEDYFSSPEIMMEVQLEFQKWKRMNVLQDAEMGLPEKRWDGINIDFQNSWEQSWFGCEIRFFENDTPDTLPILQKDKKRLYELDIPDPIHGNLVERIYKYYQYIEEKRKGFEFDGRQIGETTVPVEGTEGPFTCAANLRGATEICMDMYEDPDYVHKLLDFITTGIISRIKTWKRILGHEYPVQEFGFADDSIELLSDEMYKEFVLPYHKRLVKTFSKGGPNSIHLCGRAQHHFKTLYEELNVQAFGTGFPTDLSKAREELGTDALLVGNIHPMLLRDGPKDKLVDTVKNLLGSGVIEGGRFILSDGHNVAPDTPIEHFQVVYDTGKRYGSYKRK